MKKVLVTGENSYIGNSFAEYCRDDFIIDKISMRDDAWKSLSFSQYDVIFDVAGIAHSDIGKVTEDEKEHYFAVNTDLTVALAQKAKKEGVKQFIFMSSAIVYGDSAPIGKSKVITRDTVPSPSNFYGESKLRAEEGIMPLNGDGFKVVVLRAPMIYGRGSKGNFAALEKYAKKFSLFPCVKNERSVLYIGNLVEFVRLMIENGESGTFWPQNAEYCNTSELVKKIGLANGKKIRLMKGLNGCLKILSHFSGLIDKAFGNLTYDVSLSEYKEPYRRFCLDGSIADMQYDRKHVLVVSQYFYPESFRINDMCIEWVNRGYDVTVITGIPNYPMGKTFPGYGLLKRRHEIWNGVEIFRLPLIPRGSSSVGMVLNYFSFMISGIIAGKLKNIKADIVFSFELSPMMQVLAGISFAKKLHVPHYMYVQDLWPENVITVTGIKSRLIINPINRMVDRIYKNADEIFATSPSFVDAICNREIPVDRKKVHYWPQYAEEFYAPRESAEVPEIPQSDTFKIAFTGNIGFAQGLEILPEAAKRLKGEKVQFVIVGDGRFLPTFEKTVHENGLDEMFIMIPRQPAQRIPEILSACDAAFISFKNDPLWSMTIPAKLQSYMACGMPLIASADGETRRIIEEANCGMCCDIGDANALAELIRTMKDLNLSEFGRNSREYCVEHFNKKKLMDEMDGYLNP